MLIKSHYTSFLVSSRL